MKPKNLMILPPKNKTRDNAVKVLLVLCLIFILFSTKWFAEILSPVIKVPAPIIQNASANLLFIASGLLLVLFGAVVAIAAFKALLIVTGLALIGLGLWSIWKMFQGKPVQTVLPDEMLDFGRLGK